jgi:superfamily II DNA or RNA helicase
MTSSATRDRDSRAAPPAPTSLSLILSPRGRLSVDPEPLQSSPVDPGVARRTVSAFSRGSGHGLLHLGAVEIEARLPPALAHFRDLGRAFVSRLCHLPDAESVRAGAEVPVDEAAAAACVDGVPPMRGAEYVSRDVVGGLWTALQAALREDLAASGGSVEAYLRRASPVWNLVGRVHFHLAESKRTPETPFAFLATYTTGVSAAGTVQHAPLGQALREYAGARNRGALLSLLAPVQRAAERCPWVKALVDAGAIYQPLAWSPEEALGLLRDIEALEAVGLVVKVPDFWKGRRPARPTVQVTVGSRAPAGMGADALLDFDVQLTLDGDCLTAAEARQILAASSGLVLLRGRWVEVDHDRLRDVLGKWRDVEKAYETGGLSFLEALRLVAGASVVQPEAAPVDGPDAAWSRVAPGPWLSEALAGLRSPEGLAAASPGPDLRTDLRPYQQVGVRWLWWLRSLGLGACLADDMGLGKTIQVIALLLLARRAGAGASLLVVPASLIGNWRAEIDRFAPDLGVLVAHGSEHAPDGLPGIIDGALAGTDVVITSYGTLPRLPALLERAWDTVVIDEAQAIKNPGTGLARAVKRLQGRLRLALTGTPVENRLSDLWSIFDFCSPGLLGSAREFAAFVKRLEARPHDAYGPLRALVRPYILRRLKTDKAVIADLPEKTEMRAFCALTRKQAALYQDAVKGLRHDLETAVEGITRRGLVLSYLMRLKQICNHPSQWLGDGAYAAADSGKFQRLSEIVEELAARQERALVFTQFRELTEPLAAHLARLYGRPGLVLSGETGVRRRTQMVEAFQAEEGPPFFVLSLRAGGTGLNLTAASHVIHFDRWWNPAVEDQATDRAFRIGQPRNVMVHKLVCRGTLEERIDLLIESKRALSRQVVESGEVAALTELSNEEILRMVSLDVRAAMAEP